MYLDMTWHGGFHGGHEPICPSCKQPIAQSAPTEDLHFDPDPVHKLEELNGTYHAQCARPFLSIQRALQTLKGAWGR